jgi:hypothetical protein
MAVSVIEISIQTLPDDIIRVIRGYVDLNRFDSRELSERLSKNPTEWFEYENGLVLLPTIQGGYSDIEKNWIRDEFPLYQAIAYICDDSQGNIDPNIKKCDYARHQTIKMIQNENYDDLILYNDYEDKTLFKRDQMLYLNSL